MTFNRVTQKAGIFVGVMFAGTFAVSASAQTLPPDLTAKAKEFKQADSKYVQALCDGSKSERADAKTARARSQGELEKMIVDTAGTAPDVQKALDVATDAGDAADKVAGNIVTRPRRRASSPSRRPISAKSWPRNGRGSRRSSARISALRSRRAMNAPIGRRRPLRSKKPKIAQRTGRRRVRVMPDARPGKPLPVNNQQPLRPSAWDSAAAALASTSAARA
jgi:hypothetical protein